MSNHKNKVENYSVFKQINNLDISIFSLMIKTLTIINSEQEK